MKVSNKCDLTKNDFKIHFNAKPVFFCKRKKKKLVHQYTNLIDLYYSIKIIIKQYDDNFIKI